MDEHESHGHSTAAWTGVITIMVGSLVMSLAVVFPSVVWFIVGALICVAGVVAGKVLSMAGFGAKAATHASARGDNGPASPRPGTSQHNSGTT
ncbi:MAG: HGxxPAAW family protein [Lapillicoccus sp.]